MYCPGTGSHLYRLVKFLRVHHVIFATNGCSSNQITQITVRVVPMVMLLKMTVGKLLWLLALFAATTFANNLTCTDLSWENNVKRAAVTLRNPGNVRNELCLFA